MRRGEHSLLPLPFAAVALIAMGATLLLTVKVAGWGVLAAAGPLLNITEVLVRITLGTVLAAVRRRHPAGWLLLGSAVATTVQSFVFAYSLYPTGASVGPLPGADAVLHVGLPALHHLDWVLGGLLFLTLPDGRLPSRRWRPVAALLVGSYAVLVFVLAITPHAPYGTPNEPFSLTVARERAGTALGFLARWSWPALQVAVIAAGFSILVRLRSAEGELRQQVKWVGTGAATLAVYAFVIAQFLGPSPFGPVSVIFFLGTVGIAILRHRLLDIDVVLSKALVYSALAGIITAVYVAAVTLTGARAAAIDSEDLAVSVVATLVIAVLFHPARERLQRIANRMVYGQRSTPYEAMAAFSRQIADAISTDELLSRIAKAAAEGLAAERVRVRVFVADGEQHFTWPPHADGPYERTVVIHHHQRPVGEIAIGRKRGDPLQPAEERLLEDLARQAGPALHNVGLALNLRERIEQVSEQATELRESRQRLVTAQDRERRRLERDLHDGAQQQLVSLAGQLRLLRHLASERPAAVAPLADRLTLEADEALEGVRSLAQGIFPKLLADRGVVAALEAHVERHMPTATVVASPEARSTRIGAEREAAVYFCCLEALQNVSKHAPGSEVAVTLAASGDEFCFAVSDEGPGFALGTSPGAGLVNLRDRIEGVGGRIEIVTAPGRGTVVRGSVPVEPDELR